MMEKNVAIKNIIEEEVALIYKAAREKNTADIDWDIYHACITAPTNQLSNTVIEICRLMDAAHKGAGVITHYQVMAFCCLRYCLELLANIAAILDVDGEERSKRLKRWLQSRTEMMPDTRGEFYVATTQDSLNKPIKNRVPRGWDANFRGQKTKVYQVNDIRFDVLGLTFEEKSKHIPKIDKDHLVYVYKLATSISHGSYFGLWPSWHIESPAYFAVQCMGAMFHLDWQWLGKPDRSQSFVYSCYDILSQKC